MLVFLRKVTHIEKEMLEVLEYVNILIKKDLERWRLRRLDIFQIEKTTKLLQVMKLGGNYIRYIEDET